MLNCHQIVLCLFCLQEAGSRHTSFTDFYVESVKFMYPRSSLYYANVTLRRSGREHPKLFFEVDLLDALRNYEGDVKLYYSPIGNRRFMLLPYKVERKPICNVMDEKLVLQVFQSLQNISNVPQPQPDDENVPYCDLFTSGHYSVHNFMVDKSVFPPITPTGRFRLVAFTYERSKKEAIQSIEFLATFI